MKELSFKKSILASAVALFTLTLAACGGGGGTNASPSTATTISGTVPGTLIRAYGDNGSFYEVASTNNGTTEHPFSLTVPAGMGFRLVMVTNEGTVDEVVQPIAFKDSTGAVKDRIVFGKNEVVDLGNVNLYMSRNEAVADDTNGDGILDKPFILDDKAGAKNPLLQVDADNDGVKDFADTDHGNYDYVGSDPKDANNDHIMDNLDKITNSTPCTTSTVTDSDCDGVPDTVDSNRQNATTAGSNKAFIDDLNGDGYHDDDSAKSGLHADDLNKDGFHDDDLNKDGFHDDDLNKDGFHDDDKNHDGMHDNEVKSKK